MICIYFRNGGAEQPGFEHKTRLKVKMDIPGVPLCPFITECTFPADIICFCTKSCYYVKRLDFLVLHRPRLRKFHWHSADGIGVKRSSWIGAKGCLFKHRISKITLGRGRISSSFTWPWIWLAR